MTSLFISDLHLCPQTPKITEQFKLFCLHLASKAEHLYILGDFFASWVGDDESSAFIQEIQECLTKLHEQGVKLYFLPGNRDFLLGSGFLDKCSMQLLEDKTLINLYGKPTLLSHGDIFCTKDLAYQRFRKITRHPLFINCLLKLPLSWRLKLANYLRSQAEHYVPVSLGKTDAEPAAIRQSLKENQTLQIIHGHTHLPGIHLYYEADKIWQRFVLSDWYEDFGHYLIYFEDGRYELRYF